MLKSDLNNTPSNIMSIYTTPKDLNNTGLGGKPTGRIVVRLPQNQIYVTLGSVYRILNESVKIWYALLLFQGRIGNLAGTYGVSLNHGQVPGFYIYKLFTEQDLKNKPYVDETFSDYPGIFEELSLNLIKGRDPYVEYSNTIIKKCIGVDLIEALQTLSSNEIMRILQRQPNVNTQNKDGLTPLILALINDSGKVTVEVMNKILDLNPDVNAQDKYGWTPLMTALLNGSGTVTAEVHTFIKSLFK